MVREKKAAIELSIGTIVIIVLAMMMLSLGVILIQKIFFGATESVDTLNQKVKNEITNLFLAESSRIAVKLGGDRTARIKAGSGQFGIGIGAKKADLAGNAEQLRFKLSLQEGGSEYTNCVRLAGAGNVKKWFLDPIDSTKPFDEWEGANAFSIVSINIPDTVPVCTQKVFIELYDDSTGSPSARSFFIIEIKSGGIF